MSNNTTQRPFHNTSSQREREQVLRNDQRTTFHAFAIAEARQVGGRFAAEERAEVVGAKPTPPDLPAPDWANDPTGQEPPLGYRIDQQEPVGESFEIERSLGTATPSPADA